MQPEHDNYGEQAPASDAYAPTHLSPTFLLMLRTPNRLVAKGFTGQHEFVGVGAISIVSTFRYDRKKNLCADRDIAFTANDPGMRA